MSCPYCSYMEKKEKAERKEHGKSAMIFRRFRLVIIFFIVAFVVIAGRLVYIVAFQGEEYSQAALSQAESSAITLTAKRGDITDKNGIVLATSTIVYELILDPALILTNEDDYLEPTLAALSEYFGFDEDEMRETIYDNPDSHYIVIGEELTYSEIEGFVAAKEEDSDIVGVFTNETYKRNYTFSDLASSVLGFMSGTDGIYGLELQYNDELNGTDGVQYTYVNNDNVIETVTKEAENGNTIKTTIDYSIQSIVHTKIEEFLEENPSLTVAVIIQDPNTGAILAMEDSNDFDCNNPYDLSHIYTEEELAEMSDEEIVEARSSVWTNFCVTSNYEPGSTFKPFTYAAGLEEGIISPDDTFTCYGSLEILEEEVSCHITSGHGTLTAKEAIAQSCNVALMYMSEEIGASTFSEYQSNFGFGKYTDIDLPNEASCSSLLYDETMSELDLATNSFGQNFNLTMIQLSTAFCSLINGGYLYQPYVCQGIYSDAGELIQSTSPTLVARTVSEETSETVKEALRTVVTEGTGTAAAIDGYVISGKTGTAEKAERDGESYVVSFIGFAPYENPEVVCYVVIDEPESGDTSGVSSGLFNSIMTDVLAILDVTPASEDYDPEGVYNTETETETEADEN